MRNLAVVEKLGGSCDQIQADAHEITKDGLIVVFLREKEVVAAYAVRNIVGWKWV